MTKDVSMPVIPAEILDLWRSGATQCRVLDMRPDPSARDEALASKIGGDPLFPEDVWPICGRCRGDLGFAFQLRREKNRMLQLFLCPECAPDCAERGSSLLREIRLCQTRPVVRRGPVFLSETVRMVDGAAHLAFDRHGGPGVRRARLEQALKEARSRYGGREVEAWLIDLDTAAERGAGFTTREFRSHLGGAPCLFDEDPELEWVVDERECGSWEHIVSLCAAPEFAIGSTEYPVVIFRRIDRRSVFTWLADAS